MAQLHAVHSRDTLAALLKDWAYADLHLDELLAVILHLHKLFNAHRTKKNTEAAAVRKRKAAAAHIGGVFAMSHVTRRCH